MFVFIGRSGCGKGTQATFLKEYLKEHDTTARPVLYIESGGRFRELIKGGSYTGKLCEDVNTRGKRGADFLGVWGWASVLVEQSTGNEHVMFDGSPRSLTEAMAMSSAFNFYGHTANVIFLNVSREWSFKHLMSRGRADDASVDAINKKLDWFDTDVMPGIEFLRNDPHCNFIEVNGEMGKEDVHNFIVSHLKVS